MSKVSVRKRGDVFQYRFEIASQEGKRKYISKLGFKTKPESERAVVKAFNKYLEIGHSFKPSEISYSDYLDYWMKEYFEINYKYSTAKSINNAMKITNEPFVKIATKVLLLKKYAIIMPGGFMRQYKNEEHLKKEIMEQSGHLFIYGCNDEHRSEFLKSLESDYPILHDSNRPVAVYLDSIGMPKIDANLKNKDSYLISASCREYLSFLVAARILERTMKYDDRVLNDRLSELIRQMNDEKNMGYADIKSAQELLREIKASRDFYYKSYINYVKGLIDSISIDGLALPFLELEMFVRDYKEAMNIDSYFGVIFDKKSPIALSSTYAINNLIGSRINGDISVKVATTPNDWDVYTDANGEFIQETHDYSRVELDDSYNEHMKILTKHL